MATPATKLKPKRRLSFRPLPSSGIPKVVPPRSVVILASVDSAKTPEWEQDRGRIFRIGYYNRSDGLNCIWLVNEAGEYEQTTDRQTLLNHFVILKLSDEEDLYGDSRPPLRPMPTKRKPAFAIPGMLR